MDRAGQPLDGTHQVAGDEERHDHRQGHQHGPLEDEAADRLGGLLLQGLQEVAHLDAPDHFSPRGDGAGDLQRAPGEPDRRRAKPHRVERGGAGDGPGGVLVPRRGRDQPSLRIEHVHVDYIRLASRYPGDVSHAVHVHGVHWVGQQAGEGLAEQQPPLLEGVSPSLSKLLDVQRGLHHQDR